METEKRAKTGGRQKGSLNKTTKAAKLILEESFRDMGGKAAFVRWGRENPTEFYKIWAKLLPADIKAELTGANGGPIAFDGTVKVSFAKAPDRPDDTDAPGSDPTE
jgi:hypothetical protein